MVAQRNAVAVCPEGKELRVEWSGLHSLTVYFSPFTMPAISTAEKALLTVSSPHELRPCTPAAFRPQVAASGTYCV